MKELVWKKSNKVSYKGLIYIFIADNISISMSFVCVILCLFSALSRRVGALQISIIIIIIKEIGQKN